MERLDISRFSDRFSARQMVEADVPALYSLARTNPQYYAFCGPMATEESLRADLVALPPGKSLESKHYVGFYDGGALTAVLDLVEGYPDGSTAYIGFFMVAGDRSGRGIGSAIIEHLCGYLASAGFAAVRLAYVKSNPQAARFWTKNRFAALREVDHPYGHMVVAQRTLSHEEVTTL